MKESKFKKIIEYIKHPSRIYIYSTYRIVRIIDGIHDRQICGCNLSRRRNTTKQSTSMRFSVKSDIRPSNGTHAVRLSTSAVYGVDTPEKAPKPSSRPKRLPRCPAGSFPTRTTRRFIKHSQTIFKPSNRTEFV